MPLVCTPDSQSVTPESGGQGEYRGTIRTDRPEDEVQLVFRERAEARNAPRLFPSRGAPLSPEDQARARANRLLTVISRRPQPERERIWRRFRVFETYMA